ncbi:flippase [Salinirubellus salinus]|uniref:Flippase n=1 Tax=Salinirubellus salinus TaxID=1364945 RepID=A0A9E7QZ69_9EURY|nr:flippase [Salinirubellus salinus]UWM52745.1 flippase [Salinirubellus salinus]
MPDSLSDEETQSSLNVITHGASLFFIGRILAKGFRFVLNLILTRGLGASLYGIYAYATTLTSLAVVLARLGAGKSLLRFLPAYADDSPYRNYLVGLAYLTALLGSVLIGAALYLAAPAISGATLNNPLLVDVLRILSLALPFSTLIKLTNEIFRGLKKLEYQVLLADILHPLTQIGVVMIALLLGYSLLGVVASLALGSILVCLVAVTLLYARTSLRPHVSGGQRNEGAKEFFSYSIPLTLKDVGSVMYSRVDILMVGFFLAESTVGIYQVAFLLSGLLALPLNAFNQLFPPVASQLYTNGEIRELQSVYETVTRWTLTLAIPLALVAAVYSSELLLIFGPEFSGGAVVLTLFAVGQITNCAVGPSGYFLMMTDHQQLTMINQWLLGGLNIVLNYILITELGVIGAALATASVLSFINIIRVIEVWYTEGLTPYSKAYWKPTTAGILTAVFMSGLHQLFDGYVLLIIGAPVGGLLFFCIVFVLGLEKDDREFFNRIISE